LFQQPIVNCVTPRLVNGTASNGIVWFGYNNFNPHIVDVTKGADNHFTAVSGGERRIRVDMRQPTRFYPGKHDYVFSVR